MSKKMNPVLTWTLIALPILIGGYLILKKLGVFSKKEKRGVDKEVKDNTSVYKVTKSKDEVRPTEQKYFPMSRGSKGEKVYELQQAILSVDPKALPKYGADKDFGSETERAVLKLLNKKTIDSQEDIAAIAKIKATNDAAAITSVVNKNRVALGQQLADAWKQKKNLDFYAVDDTQVTTAKIEPVTNRYIQSNIKVYKANQKIADGNNIKSIVVDKLGFLTLYGEKESVRISPYGCYLKY